MNESLMNDDSAMDESLASDSVAPSVDGDRVETPCDLRMYITDAERERALEVKQAVEACEDLKPLPDFEYVHLALSCNGSIDVILDTAFKLQSFRELYRLEDSVEDGINTFQSLVEMQPGFILDVTYLPSEECYSGVCDLAANKPERVKTDADWRAFQGGFYYLMRAVASNLQVIRNGTSVLTECEGMGYNNLDIRFQERSVYELWSYYPCNWKECTWLNTPPAANMLYSVLKTILRKDLADAWTIGGTLPGYEGRLDTLYKMPTAKAAVQSMLARMETYLAERYHNEQTFSLLPSN